MTKERVVVTAFMNATEETGPTNIGEAPEGEVIQNGSNEVRTDIEIYFQQICSTFIHHMPLNSD